MEYIFHIPYRQRLDVVGDRDKLKIPPAFKAGFVLRKILYFLLPIC